MVKSEAGDSSGAAARLVIIWLVGRVSRSRADVFDGTALGHDDFTDWATIVATSTHDGGSR
jgi:hypothetical protein